MAFDELGREISRAADALRKHIAEAFGWEAQVPGHLAIVSLPGRPAGT